MLNVQSIVNRPRLSKQLEEIKLANDARELEGSPAGSGRRITPGQEEPPVSKINRGFLDRGKFKWDSKKQVWENEKGTIVDKDGNVTRKSEK